MSEYFCEKCGVSIINMLPGVERNVPDLKADHECTMCGAGMDAEVDECFVCPDGTLELAKAALHGIMEEEEKSTVQIGSQKYPGQCYNLFVKDGEEVMAWAKIVVYQRKALLLDQDGRQRPNVDIGTIFWIQVNDTKNRKKGYARKIIDLMKRQCEEIETDWSASSTSGRKFLKSCGLHREADRLVWRRQGNSE